MRSMIVAAILVCGVAAGGVPAVSASEGGPDYAQMAAVSEEQIAVTLPVMVQVLPEVWIPEVDLPAWGEFIRLAAVANGAREVDGELVPWSPHRDTLIDIVKPCEFGARSWHERGPSRFLGALQWVQATWDFYGGMYAPEPWLASIADQVAAAEKNIAAHGGTFHDWPGCRARYGLP